MKTENSNCEREREGKIRAEESSRDERNRKSTAGLDGYNVDKPATDDCCAICYDSFRFPCRSSCGHWFCCDCILEYWKYTANCKCKCPICASFITKLIPDSSALINQGQVGKFLEAIHTYNRLNAGGLCSLYLKASLLPQLLSAKFRNHFSTFTRRHAGNITRLIFLLLYILYDYFDLQFFPNGWLGILHLLHFLCKFLLILVVLDSLWFVWMHRRRVGHST